MCTNLNLAQSAIFTSIAMVFAGINGTLNAVVFITFVHNNLLNDLFDIIMSLWTDNIEGNILKISFRKNGKEMVFFDFLTF